MKKYIVIDKQGGNFMGWTKDNPITKQGLRAYLYNISNDGKISIDDMWTWTGFLTSAECLIDWGLELQPITERNIK